MGMTEYVDTSDYLGDPPPTNPTTPLDQLYKAAVMKYNNMVAPPVVPATPVDPAHSITGNKRKREGGGQRKENQRKENQRKENQRKENQRRENQRRENQRKDDKFIIQYINLSCVAHRITPSLHRYSKQPIF